MLKEKMGEGWRARDIRTNGVRLHVVEAGEEAAPLVVLLHGFPEYWYSWRHQIDPLVGAGYRVMVPDMRGYNLSEKPQGLAAYHIDTLAADVVGLIDAAGKEKAIVVGHDWGGAIAWHVALEHTKRVEKLAILNAPHPVVFARELRRPSQFKKSLYILYFQLPWAEKKLAEGNFRLMDKMLQRDPVHREAFSEEDRRLYCQAMAQPGALTAALNYYRKAARSLGMLLPKQRRLELPTLVIWGEQDPYLGLSLLDGLDKYVSPLRIERIPDASHWVQCDTPAKVNEALVAFFSQSL